MRLEAGRLRLTIASLGADLPTLQGAELGPAHEDRKLRASDAEREGTAARLVRHAKEGRLDFDELSDRLELVSAAQTRRDLDELLSDLPKLAPAERDAAVRKSFRTHERAYLVANSALAGGWAVLGSDAIAASEVRWPLCVAVAWGVGLLSHRRLIREAARDRTPAQRHLLPLGG